MIDAFTTFMSDADYRQLVVSLRRIGVETIGGDRYEFWERMEDGQLAAGLSLPDGMMVYHGFNSIREFRRQVQSSKADEAGDARWSQ